MTGSRRKRTTAEQRAIRLEQIRERQRLALLTGGCLVFLVLAWVLDLSEHHTPWTRVFYLLAYLCGGLPAFRRAFQSLREGSLNVDFLMIFAALGAAFVGEWPEGAVLLFLFSLSGTLEQFVLGKTRGAIEALLDLTPEEATVLRGGAEVRVGVEELKKGESILVRPGERVATDGIIKQGSTSIDCSALTGESLPVTRTVGDEVFAGTVNIDGAVEITVSKPVEETLLARIVERVEEAQSERATSQRFTEWFGERYTWLVLGGSGLTFLLLKHIIHLPVHDALYRAMTVLVVASPCAVVISIPAAILAAIAGAARSGILFKGGKHLEAAAEVTAVALDKTGTLTIGRPEVASVEPVDGTSADELLRLAAAAESLSEHPLAQAIVRAAAVRGIAPVPVQGFRASIGGGIVAEMGSKQILVGKEGFVVERGVTVTPQVAAAAKVISERAETPVFVAIDSKMIGLFGITDILRPSAQPALSELRRIGIRECIMLTGDHEQVAKHTAEILGISYRAGLLPEQKLDELRALRDRSGSVAMVGDGINDAPAIALATLGVSLAGSGTAVALETADVVLMGDDLRNLPRALSIARRARTIVHQNLAIAFGVMLVLLVSTFVLQIRLPIAVAGHEGSTVVVILNGLRMLRVRSSAGS